MKSPFTGGIAELKKESRVLEYRKDQFEILYHYYKCVDTGEQFTTTEIDTLNINQVHNKYRAKYGIPFIDEIKAIREKYDLSAAKMSEVLGLGVNIYRNYEGGEMPSVATGRLIRLAEMPNEFRKLLELSKNVLEPIEYERVKRKVDHSAQGRTNLEDLIKGLWFDSRLPNIYNGYRVPNLKRIGAMMHYFAKENMPFLTALNKLMFYADFCHFNHYGYGISGIYYKALPKGPVPNNYGIIYNYVANEGIVKTEEVNFGDYVGDRFVTEGVEIAILDDNIFSETELTTLKMVSNKFKGLTTKKIVDISHEELAWLDNVDDCNKISFEYAFHLKYIV
jgi:DNA-binding transcriptional regulator YiaG